MNTHTSKTIVVQFAKKKSGSSLKSNSVYMLWLRESRDYLPRNQTIALTIPSLWNLKIIAANSCSGLIKSGYCPTLFTLNSKMTMENQKSWTTISFPLHSGGDLQSRIRIVPVLPSSFRRINPATITFGSTKSEITGRSVPASGLSRLRAVGPLQKLAWRKSGSLPDLT